MGSACTKNKKSPKNRPKDPKDLYITPNATSSPLQNGTDLNANLNFNSNMNQIPSNDPNANFWPQDPHDQAKLTNQKSLTNLNSSQNKKSKGDDKSKAGFSPIGGPNSGVFDDHGHPINTANLFEVNYVEKNAESDDYYLDMSEGQFKQLEQFIEQSQLNQNLLPNLLEHSQPGSKPQSASMEWSKILQKLFTQEKTSISLAENKNKLLKAYRSILNLKERNWYEEVAGLYKERNMMSKATSSMTGLTFDRKLIQLQEQFRWFVSAVGNVRLNFNNSVGVHEFPPFKSSTRKSGSGGDKFDSSSASLGGKAVSVADSDEGTNQSPNRIQMMQSAIPKKSQSAFLNFKAVPQDPKLNLERELPDIFSPVWQNGFIWKGVFFRLFSKKHARKIKKEMKVLRHVAVECLQTETCFKIDTIDGTPAFMNIILPLMCTVESSSWVLLGTPVCPIKRTAQDDWTSKLAGDAAMTFKNSFLLSGITSRNFKIIHKTEEQPIQTNTFGGQSPNSGHQPINHFLMLSNVAKIVLPLPKVDVMFSLNQESNAHVTFLEYPKRGIIDPELIKRVLGYAKLEISVAALLKKDPRMENKPYHFDLLKFRRREWLIQIIYVVGREPLPSNFTRNRRAIDMISHSEKLRGKEIRGNVLVFATLMNRETLIHPYFISDSLLGLGVLESEQIDMTKNSKNKQNEPKAPTRFNRINVDDKRFQEYLTNNIGRSIDYIVDQLENTDNIINFASLKELFHRKGINMRLEWIVFIKVKNERARALLAADILARCVKKMFDDKTSRKLSRFRKLAPLNYFEASAMKEKFDELLHDKNEFLLENYYKRLLCQCLNILIKGQPDVPEEEEAFYCELSTDIFLHRMRIYDIAKRLLDTRSFDSYLSAELISTVINTGCLQAGLFLDACEYHLKLSFATEVIRQIRNDKFINWVSAYAQPIKTIDINIIFSAESYSTVRERCYLLLLKLLPTFPQQSQVPMELVVPSSLYKLRKPNSGNFECFLKEYYEFPGLEILNDWVVLLESILNGLCTCDGDQMFLIEAYLIQLVLAFFSENDLDNQLSLSILERINTYVNNSPVCSPELTITIHTWFGILSESKLFVECEQSYTMALLALHKLYGDPRGRGGVGTPWELFITWRLSILSRLQGKIHDAEYAEELFDATAMTLKDNPLNSFVGTHHVYREPFRDFMSGTSKSSKNPNYFPQKPQFKNMTIRDHPFPYWTHHLVFDENVSKIDTVNNTLQRTPYLLKWMLTHMLTFQNSGILWDTAYLRDFVLAIMQNSFSNSTSVSSLSGFSLDKGKDKNSMTDGASTPKSGILKFDKKKDRFQGGNLVQIFEKDTSTINKRELNGVVFSWGQNSDGQVGTPTSNVEELEPGKKMRIYYPKCILPLKDTIIVSVACGHTHSMAITLSRTLMAWGCNKSFQLGLGEGAPNQVYVPTVIPGMFDVSCGSEHTVAITANGLVYSWGQGEGGLLGHGDCVSLSSPKVIQALKNLDIVSVVCGGLHTLALSKQGGIYSWGRGEGGQLGVPFEQLTHDASTNELYLTVPKKIKSVEHLVMIQIACGDAHSLSLTQNGQVFGWGYTNSGQLGLGITGDNYDPSSPYSLQVKEPVVIERLANARITEIFAGSTFSLFLNDKKELYGCGLNDYNQLGLEKNIMRVNNNLDHLRHVASNKNNESAVPKKIDCFTSMPILNVACGENHSLALLFYDSYYMLFAWGMQRHGQLGIGDINAHFSTPRPISFLQYMACGAYHSLVVLGEASKTFKREQLIDRLEKKVENKWSSIAFDVRNTYEDMIDSALNNLDNIIPSEEGKIDNPKAMKKGN